ncbi:hypothetical protein NEIFL0001_0802 [Neisseria flavescens SK114]|nr:hypothetical protein NEIFL0001_0802 [Neisseria flavescens SK114]
MAGRLKQQSRLLDLISNPFRRPFVLQRPIRLIRGPILSQISIKK